MRPAGVRPAAGDRPGPGAPLVRWRLARGPRVAPAVRHGGVSWTGFTGVLALALMALMFVTGAAMTLYYSPTPGVAYDSVDYAQFNLPFGDLVRGVHAYASNLLLIVVVLHLGRAFVVGAYKSSWRWAWLSGVLVTLLVPPFLVTGDLLPWNQSGYWSTQVRLGILSSIPIVGDFLVGLLRGGSHVGIVTLTRFYVIHILFLPCLLVVAVAVHVSIVGRTLQSTVATSTNGHPGSGPPPPNVARRALLVFLVMAVVLGALSWYRPAPLGDPADPTDTSYVPRPEWWALALNQLVTIFKGRLMIVATALIPGGLIGLVLALPFIDRSPERHPARRRRAMLAAAGIAALGAGLSLVGYIEHYATTR